MNPSTLGEDLKKSFVAEQALIVYKNDGVNYNEYPPLAHVVMSHRIENGQICEGRPVTREMLLSLAQLALPIVTAQAAFLPENVLFLSQTEDLTVWWVPAQRRNLFFDSSTGVKSGMFPIPPTVFALKGAKLHVWAFKINRRPSPDTQLLTAPYFNQMGGATICTGSIEKPKTHGVAAIKAWEQLFFDSTFTSAGEPRLKGISAAALWKSLRGEKRTFPIDRLVPLKGVKVGDIPAILR